MKDEELLARITIDPKVMVGKPVIRGTRLTVDYILTTCGRMGRPPRRLLKNTRVLRKQIFKRAWRLERKL